MQNKRSDSIQQLVEGIFEALPVPATLIDADGVIVDINSAFIEMARHVGVEFNKEDRIGYPLHEFAREEEERERIQGIVKALLETGEEQYLRHVYEGADNVSFRDVRAMPIKDAADRVLGGIILREDVSKAVLGERESARQRQLLAAFDRIGRQVLSTLDERYIVDVLVEEVMRLNLFRSMVVELVDMDRGLYETIRAYQMPNVVYLKDLEVGGRAEPYEEKEKARGVYLPIGESALRRDIVAQKKMLVIEGWDERFDRRFANPEQQANKVAFFVPVLREGETLAILATGCEREDKEQVLARIDALQPLLGQLALALYLARSHVFSQQQDRLQLAEQAVRLRVASMQKPEDLAEVVIEIATQLRELGVEFASCSIQIINTQGTGFVSVDYNKITRWKDRSERFRDEQHAENDRLFPWVRETWQTGKTHYQPSTPVGGALSAGWSVVDVAFSRGTLAINSLQSNAFTAQGIELVERLAAVLSEGFQRLEDLEARERMDRTLHEQNELLRAIVEGSQDSIVVKDHEGRRILVNPAVAEWVGQKPEELLGKKNEDLFPADLAHKLDAEDQRVMESGEVGINENTIPSSHGLRYVQTHKYPLRDEEGQVRGLIGIGRDITEIRRRDMLARAVAQVRESVWQMRSTEDVRQVVEAVRQGLRNLGIDFAVCGVNIVRDSEDTYDVQTYNITAADQWIETSYQHGAVKDEIFLMWREGGVHYRPDLSTDEVRDQAENINRVFGEAVCSVVDVAFAQGTLAVNSTRVDAFSARDRAALEEVAHALEEGFRRLDDLRRLEEANKHLQLEVSERQAMEAQLVQSERLRVLGELAAGISHNLNNILTGVLAPAQLLKWGLEDPQQTQQAIDDIFTSAQRAADLVQRLGRSVHGDQSESLRSIDANKVVREVVQATRPRWQDEAQSRGVHIDLDLELHEIPPIKGSEAGLHEMLVNLIFNAVDAMPAGGRIELSASASGAFVVLVVRDTGKGMSPETRRRVFEPFFTTKASVGTGLGLSTLNGMVRRWGGMVSVDSVQGKGTTFHLRLPVWREAVVEVKKSVNEEGSLEAARLLVVEDDPVVGSILARALKMAERIDVATNGVEALELFAPGHYDAVLIDLSLPGMPGDQIATQIKQMDATVVTIMMTGWILEEGDPRLAPFDYRLQKPFVPQELRQIVGRAVGS
jgi:PAS domain S-box-containing protein